MPKWRYRAQYPPLSVVWGSWAIVGGMAFGLWSWESGEAARSAAWSGVIFGPLLGLAATATVGYAHRRMATVTGVRGRASWAVLAESLRERSLPDDPGLDVPLSRLIDWCDRRRSWVRWSPWICGVVAAGWLAAAVAEGRWARFGVAALFALLFVLTLGAERRYAVRSATLREAIAARADASAETAADRAPPGETERAPIHRTWWERACALAVVVVLVVAGIAVDAAGGHSDLRGPSGAFPAPIDPPVRSVRQGAQVPGGSPAYHGVTIETGTDAKPVRVSAVNMRTGAGYWTWNSRADGVAGTAIDPGTGGVAVVSDVSRANAMTYRLTMIDLRTGKTRWRRSVPGAPDDPSDTAVMAASGVIAVAEPGGMEGFDPHDGRRRWTTRWSGDCRVRPYGQALADLLVVALTCGDGARLAVHEPASGRLRWSLPATWLIGDGPQWDQGDHLTVNGGALVVWSADTTVSIDMATGRILRVAGSRRGELAGGIGAGVEVTACSPKTKDGAPRGLCANDPVNGRSLWRYRMPASWALAESTSQIVAAQGRVYALVVNDAGRLDLLIVDARTGRRAGQVALAPSAGQAVGPAENVLAVVGDSVAFGASRTLRVLIGP